MKGGSGEPQGMAFSEHGLDRIPELSNPNPDKLPWRKEGRPGLWPTIAFSSYQGLASPPELQDTLETDRSLVPVYFPRLQVEESSNQEQSC